ncbi:MAG: hypothetical protein IJS97_08310 [Prevotella sp.]|nr:hypothetical protein [Prevotella sp.]
MFQQILNYILTGGHPYRRSSRRKVYEEIADLLDESPDKVYRIAHNPFIATVFDGSIVTELHTRGVIVRQ